MALADSITENSNNCLEALDPELSNFCRLLACFDCQLVPLDLFIRASRTKPSWAPNGELVQISPVSVGVPIWLLNLLSQKAINDDSQDQTWLSPAQKLGAIELVVECGVQYVRLVTDFAALICSELDLFDRCELLSSLLSITIQAFPCRYAEISGEEMGSRFLGVLESSILPLLAVITDEEIIGWASSKENITVFLIFLLEFLYDLSLILKAKHPALLRNIPKRLLALIRRDPELAGVSDSYCSILAKLKDDLTAMALENHESSRKMIEIAGKQSVDERTNATIGMTLAFLLSNTNTLSIDVKLFVIALQLVKQWKPLSLTKPSTMEYITASCLMAVEDFRYLLKDDPDSPDAAVIAGFNLARNRSYGIAVQFLQNSMANVESIYGSISLEYGIIIAELANCCNILRNESFAEHCTEHALAKRLTNELKSRPDWLYLSVARADSLIGRAEYEKVVPKLQEILDHPSASDTVVMVTALRLAKVQRRAPKEGQKSFELTSPLWIGASRFRTVSSTLQSEYLEELACNLFLLTKKDIKETSRPRELLEVINSMLGNSEASSRQSPSLQWFLRMEAQYQKQVSNSSAKEEIAGGSEIERIPPISPVDSVDFADFARKSTFFKLSGSIPALHYACKSGSPSLVRILVRVSAINATDTTGMTPLSWAARNGHKAVMEILLQNGANLETKDSLYGRTPLSWAAENGHKAVVEILLEKGANLETKDSYFGHTPLSWATMNGHKAVVEILLEKGANLETKDSGFERTPLSWATGNGYEAVVEILLEKGANLETKDSFGYTPLSWAAMNGYEAIVKLLIEAGADLESMDLRNRTPLALATEYGRKAIVDLLLAKGAKPLSG